MHRPDASVRLTGSPRERGRAHGAGGCVAGSVPEKLYRQMRALRIYAGTSEVQQLVVGRAVCAGRIG